jgi:hypothetical protein
MTTPITYTGTLTAYITNSYTTPATIAASGNPLNDMGYYRDGMNLADWIKVGTAEITVTMLPESDVVAGMVSSIDAQIANTYAEAESRINLLKEKKQSLLAITMEN